MSDYAAGMRRGAEIAKTMAKKWRNSPESATLASVYEAAAIRVADAILAAIPAPAPWTPPEDRPEIAAWLVGSWAFPSYQMADGYCRSEGIDSTVIRRFVFAPLPPAPEAQP